jgi:hypothetical protein
MVTQKRDRTVKLLAMAFNRKDFKNKLQDTVAAALTHFYMVNLAQLNHQTKWVQHWQTEIDRLVNMDMVRTLVSEINGHWDKRRALDESIQDVQAADTGYRRVAVNYVKKVYQLKKIQQQPPTDAANVFYTMVSEAAERALTPDDME